MNLYSYTSPFSLLAQEQIAQDTIMRLRFYHGADKLLDQQLPFGVLNNSAYSFTIPFDGTPDSVTFGLQGPHTLDGFVRFDEPRLTDVLYTDVQLRLTDVRVLGTVVNGRMTVDYNGVRTQAVPEPATWSLLLCALLFFVHGSKESAYTAGTKAGLALDAQFAGRVGGAMRLA